MSLVRPLTDITRDDLASAGGKGANLGELVRAGFPVPEGFVVTTEAYDSYVASQGIRDAVATLGVPTDTPDAEPRPESDAARIRALFVAPIPDAPAREIVAAYEQLGPDAVVAVRSSATAEDLPDASFAGQQDTYLGVQGASDLLDAVRRCWASLWTDRAVAYRARAGVDPGSVSLAVVVQRLVDADAAGILFTANPATGRRRETVINAAFGLGEAVVGGEVTPDELVVAEGRVASRTTADKVVRTVRDAVGTHTEAMPADQRRTPVLTDAQAVELADLGRRIEAHFGVPQDIEWVLAGGAFSIVQARPITALPEPTGPIPTDWSVRRHDGMYIRASIVEQLPDPLSPLFTDLISGSVSRSLETVLTRYFGGSLLRAGDMEFPTINGYGYYFYSVAGMLRLCLAAPRAFPAVFSPGTLNGVSFWRENGLPTYRRIVAEWSGRDEHAMTDVELLAGASALVDAGAEYYTTVQAVIPNAATAEIVFTRLYNALGRRAGDPPATTFLVGFESAPIRAERDLHALAAWCRPTPGVAEALLAGREAPDAHRAEFDARLGDYLAAHGHLTYNLDVMQPVPADDPAPVLVGLRFALSEDAPDPDDRLARLAAERTRAEEALFGRLDPVRGAVLRRALASAQELVPIREDALADIGLGWPAARRFLRELGSRLVDAGALDDRDDVFWLTRAEIEASASEPVSLAETVATRQETWRGQRLANPPGWLPAKGFFYDVFKGMMPGVEGPQEGPTLRGLGASAGRVTGRARVLAGPEDFSTMQPGEILVAAITTPAYTPFFAMASGVVTDIGGPLSHSSIVAREYGIPAVLGTGSATARISTGDEITVDGDRGVVILDAAAAEMPSALKQVSLAIPKVALAAGAALAGVGAMVLAQRRRHRQAR